MLKKILFLILIPIIAFTTCCTNVDGKSGSETVIQNVNHRTKELSLSSNAISKGYDDGYSEPVTGEYEILENAKTADATKDSYEDNNSIGSSTLISPTYDGTYAARDYSKIIYGTLHKNEWLWGLIKREVDEDYYRFVVYGKAIVSINLENIPSGCDYDLELYEHDNTRYAEEEQVTLVNRSNAAGSSNEHINKTLLPGVYYIRINSYNDGFNAQSEYKLSLNVDYNYENASISELRYTKGVGAALWVSDYDPFGIEAFTSQSKSEVGLFTSSQYYSAYKFGNPLFHYIRDDSGIKHASLYIWDLNIRRAIYDIVKSAIQKLEVELANSERIRLELDITSKVINGVSTITGLALMFVPVANVPASIKLILDVTSLSTTIGPSLLDCIFNTIMPNSLIEQKSNYLNYLRVLAAALECNSSTSNQEVIKIDSNYKIVSESVFGIVQMNYDIDFTPSIQSNYLYDSDTIYAFQSGAKFNGTIYPLKTLDDINNARKKNQSNYEDINTGGDTELLLDKPIAGELNVGEYKWYHFTAPENGIYTFQTNSEIDTYGEIFSQIIPGYSTSGRIMYNDDDGDNRNFKLSYEIYKGRTIYLRVRGYNWKSTGLYSLYVQKTGDANLIDERINGEDFGFQNEYVDDLNRKAVITDSGFSFTTQRIRCGYINNQYLSLSAKCKNAGTAYLQLDFTQDIQSFDFGIAIWSDEEYLNQKSSIILETKGKDGVYRTKYIFNIAEMSKNKDVLDNYSFSFDEETYGIRIKVTTNQVNYEKNKGRVVLSDFVVRHS